MNFKEWYNQKIWTNHEADMERCWNESRGEVTELLKRILPEMEALTVTLCWPSDIERNERIVKDIKKMIKEGGMKKPKELTDWDFPNTLQVPGGWDLKSIPDLTRDNFQVLIDEHNNLVEAVNHLCEKLGESFEEGE